ncbi:hypothetical protein PR048_027298 [Dryococelus australis]|uniref:Uncharacterized protein n=1 Tax=Dryococelus australis TaxID=614101 RepID=A0ABQ9GF26_9NEOP|nr:hypothetical protein PR048_027298 [Dryococelus australis]
MLENVSQWWIVTYCKACWRFYLDCIGVHGEMKRNALTDKIDFKHVYTEVDFAIGSQFIRHALGDSEPIADLQGNKFPILGSVLCRTITNVQILSMRILVRRDGAAVTTRLPPCRTRFRFPAGSLPVFRTWESCRTMPLVGGFSRGSPVPPAPSFRRCSILTSHHPHRISSLDVKSRPNLFTPLQEWREKDPFKYFSSNAPSPDVCGAPTHYPPPPNPKLWGCNRPLRVCGARAHDYYVRRRPQFLTPPPPPGCFNIPSSNPISLPHRPTRPAVASLSPVHQSHSSLYRSSLSANLTRADHFTHFTHYVQSRGFPLPTGRVSTWQDILVLERVSQNQVTSVMEWGDLGIY